MALLSILLLGAMMSGPASGAPEDDGVALTGKGLREPGWVAVKLEVESSLHVATTVRNVSHLAQAVAQVYSEDRRLLGGISFGVVEAETGAAVSTVVEGERIGADQLVGPQRVEAAGIRIEAGAVSSVAGFSMSWSPSRRVVYAVAWSAGDAATWDFEISSPSGRVLAVASGNATYAFAPRDFVAQQNVGVYAASIGVTLVDDGVVRLPVKDTLVGTFSYVRQDIGPLEPPNLTFATPKGTFECPCNFAASWSGAPHGPGEYEFRIAEQFGVRRGFYNYPMVFAADIRLPP